MRRFNFVDHLNEVIDDEEMDNRAHFMNGLLESFEVVLYAELPFLLLHEEVGSQPRPVEQVEAKHDDAHQTAGYHQTLCLPNVDEAAVFLRHLQPDNFRIEQKGEVTKGVVDS